MVTHISPPCTTTNIIPSCHAICILFPPSVDLTIHHICRSNGFTPSVLTGTNFLPTLYTVGWNLTCNRASHQPAKPTWSSSSCPAGSLERSGTRSRSWFWPPWCRWRTRWRWRGNLCVAERRTGTALRDARRKILWNARRLEMIVFDRSNRFSVVITLSLFGLCCCEGQQFQGWFSLFPKLMVRLFGWHHPGNSKQQWFLMFLTCAATRNSLSQVAY